MTNFTFLRPNYYKEIGKLILAEGADLSVKNDENITPLDWIILVNETETADRIRKRGEPRPLKNLKLKANEITTNHNRISSAGVGLGRV